MVASVLKIGISQSFNGENMVGFPYIHTHALSVHTYMHSYIHSGDLEELWGYILKPKGKLLSICICIVTQTMQLGYIHTYIHTYKVV